MESPAMNEKIDDVYLGLLRGCYEKNVYFVTWKCLCGIEIFYNEQLLEINVTEQSLVGLRIIERVSKQDDIRKVELSEKILLDVK